MSSIHTLVRLADDLTWEQFLQRLQPTPVKGGTSVLVAVGGALHTVPLVLRRFACGQVRLIGTEPVSDRWYYYRPS